MSSSEADEIDSLPSSSTSSSVDDDEYVSDAEREWRESLQQMELLLTMVLVPYIGKYFGRKCAYWGTSWKMAGRASRMLMHMQVGRNGWNGTTQSRSSCRVQRHSSWLGLWRQQHHFRHWQEPFPHTRFTATAFKAYHSKVGRLDSAMSGYVACTYVAIQLEMQPSYNVEHRIRKARPPRQYVRAPSTPTNDTI